MLTRHWKYCWKFDGKCIDVFIPSFNVFRFMKLICSHVFHINCQTYPHQTTVWPREVSVRTMWQPVDESVSASTPAEPTSQRLRLVTLVYIAIFIYFDGGLSPSAIDFSSPICKGMYKGLSNVQGDVQCARGCLIYKGMSNVQGDVQCTRGCLMYKGMPNLQGAV